jgi:hypothetical protein
MLPKSISIGLKKSFYLLILLPPLTILACTIFNMCLGRVVGNIIFPIPTADLVARDYLHNLAIGNTENLGDLVPNYQKYRGVEIQNIRTKAEYQSGNSDHLYEIVTVNFEYRDLTKGWQSDSFTLMTDSNLERGDSFFNNLPFRKVFNSGWN